MTVVGVLATLWQDFQELNLLEQAILVAGWLGIPSIFAYLIRLTRLAHLTKALEGYKAETAELTKQVSELERRNCKSALEKAKERDARSAATILIDTAGIVSKELARSLEELAKIAYTRFYEEGDRSQLDIARTSARQAFELDETSMTAALLVDEGIIAENHAELLPDDLFDSMTTPDAAEGAMAIIIDRISHLLKDFNDKEALQIARRALYALKKADLLGTLGGFYGCLAYIKATIFMYDRIDPPSIVKHQMDAVSDRMMTLAYRYFNVDDLSYFVAMWHRASAQRIIGGADEVLSVISDKDVIRRTSFLFGDGHNCPQAWRILLARTLAESGSLEAAATAVSELEVYFAKYPRMDQKRLVKLLRNLIQQRRKTGGAPMKVSTVPMPGAVRLI